MNIRRREKLLELLKDKEYRDAFVSEHIDTGLPFQIKALREEREWSQEKLGSKAGMHQERISALEDPNYGKFTLRTLKKLASAFDVALMVVFVPFSKLLDWESNLSPEDLQAVSFEEDNFSLEKSKEGIREETIADKINPHPFLRSYSPVIPNNPMLFSRAFKGQESQESGLIMIIKEKENEASLYKPSPIPLVRTVS